jgi:hypothetical protein
MDDAFKGYESEALETSVALYMVATEKSRETVVREIQARLDERREGLTWRDIEGRNYTYVTVTRLDAGGSEHHYEKFLVASAHREQALALAKRYVARQGWQLQSDDGTYSTSCRCCRCYTLYPRNYVRASRKLFTDGKFL